MMEDQKRDAQRVWVEIEGRETEEKREYTFSMLYVLCFWGIGPRFRLTHARDVTVAELVLVAWESHSDAHVIAVRASILCVDESIVVHGKPHLQTAVINGKAGGMQEGT